MRGYSLFKRVVKHITTERDGESFDTTKVTGLVGTLVFLGLSIYTTIINPTVFNPVNFGIAFASILGATAAGVKIKETTEQDTTQGNSATQVQEHS